MRRLHLGVIGLGRAFSLMLPTLAHHPKVEIVAGTDVRVDARERFAREFAVNAHPSADALAGDPNVEAIYISTPHELHAAHAQLAAAHGKHIMVEKPMALSLTDCTAMIDAARAAGVVLMVGPSHSFDAPMRRARDLIASGAFGELRMIQALNYTDWLYRPRRPEELDPSAGGVLVNQAPHQVDMVRLIAGGLAQTVRASVGAWDRARPAPAAYAAHVSFAGGAFASLTMDTDISTPMNSWAGSGRAVSPKTRPAPATPVRGLPVLQAPSKKRASRRRVAMAGPTTAGRPPPREQLQNIISISAC
jgi:phthalate 4,5-cis-dihydrodiol dehydrogenase